MKKSCTSKKNTTNEYLKRLILMNAFFEMTIQLLFFCKYKLSDSHASNSKRSELYERSLQIMYLDKQS